MSRIDEALRRRSVREAHDLKIAVRGQVDVVEDRSALDRYAAESNEPVAPEKIAILPTPHARELAPPTPRRGVVPRPVHFDRESGGKLVVSHAVPPHAIVQYRRLAGAVAQWKRKTGLKTVLVTSALPREGRTLTVVNLALTFSESFGRRVLLIDADQRCPSIHTIVGVDNTRGLSDTLSAERDDVAVTHVSENLSVMPAGRPHETSSSALTTNRMKRLLQRQAEQFDWVLLDSAPVESMENARLLANIAGAVLVVIGAGTTRRRQLARAIVQLGPEYVIGIVLNRVAPTSDVPCVAP